MDVAPIRKGGTRTAAVAAAAIGMATVALLAGCMMRVPVHESKIEEQVPAKVAGIVPQQSDRASVRAQLGEPWLSSAYWQFDLYHLTGRSTSVPVMWVFWWPVPLGVAVDESTTYVLEAYDSAGRVTESASDVARDPSIFEGMDNGPPGGQPGIATTARVTAGEVQFVTTQGEGDAEISVAAPKRDGFLAHPVPTSECRLIVGCSGGACDFDVSIDDGHAVKPPFDSFSQAVVALHVLPGSHKLRVASSRMLQAFEATQDITCAPAESLFATVVTEFAAQETLRSHWNATIQVSRELPEALKDARLVIWSRGAWQVPTEPVAQ